MEKAINSTVVFKTVGTKTLASIGAVAAAVVLPQLLHMLGMVSNMGTALGEIFLPMHIAIFMVGLLAGPVAGAASGALAPIVSFGLTGMPTVYMLPFMVIELAMYGLISGLFADKKMPSIAKVLIAQIGGRTVRAAAIIIGFYIFKTHMSPEIILTSIYVGLPGLIIQWIFIPLAVFYIDRKAQYE